MSSTRRCAVSLSSAWSSPTVAFHHQYPHAPHCPAPWPTSISVAGRHGFHAGQAPSDDTHYEILKVSPDASTSEIKRSFYRLSKLHHPDHNQDDPHASRRFVRISEAYAILGQADKRALYDREHRHRLQQYRQEHHASASSSSSSSSITPRANSSYHSTGPAGGRPASGLSRRRTTFKGPPPSFYRQTGHHHASAGHTTSSSPNSSSSSSSHQHPFDARQNPHTPHFDRAANERTHQRLDARLARRRAEAAGVADLGTEASSEPSTLLGFLVVSAALVAGIVLPALVFGNSKTPPNPKSSDSQRTSQA